MSSEHPLDQPIVYLVDANADSRDTQKTLLASIGLNVVDHAGADAFFDAYDAAAPGCLLLHIVPPPDQTGSSAAVDGLAVQRRLLEQGYDLPLIIVAAAGDVSAAVEAMKNGAFDFIEQPFNDQRLLDSVQSALAQDRARRQANRYRDTLLARFENLTGREKEVMLRVVQGMPNRLIAEDLSVSPKTVEVHRSKVMEKMQVGSLSELISVAVKIGVLDEFVELRND